MLVEASSDQESVGLRCPASTLGSRLYVRKSKEMGVLSHSWWWSKVATLPLGKGVHPKIVSERLGQSRVGYPPLGHDAAAVSGSGGMRSRVRRSAGLRVSCRIRRAPVGGERNSVVGDHAEACVRTPRSPSCGASLLQP